MWPEPRARLTELRRLLRPCGRIALVSQPRPPGATSATTPSAADDLAALLTETGFEQLPSRRSTSSHQRPVSSGQVAQTPENAHVAARDRRVPLTATDLCLGVLFTYLLHILVAESETLCQKQLK
jgi:hypothetical protein